MATREDIQSGDLLAWKTDTRSGLSRAFLKVIRWVTRKKLAHTGIALRMNGELFVLEATMPFVRLLPIRDDETFYWVKTDVTLNQDSWNFAMEVIGLLYSLRDSIASIFGWTVEDNDIWQCVEICQEMLLLSGLTVDSRLIPGEFVDEVSRLTGNPIVKIGPVQ